VSLLQRCPSYRKSNKGSTERQGPTLGVQSMYLRAIFQVQDPGGGGLYLEGLIHGGAYFRNFTVLIE